MKKTAPGTWTDAQLRAHDRKVARIQAEFGRRIAAVLRLVDNAIKMLDQQRPRKRRSKRVARGVR